MDPSQQMNSTLWQRHRASTETLFFHKHIILLDDQYAKCSKWAKSHCFPGCLHMQCTQNHLMYWLFLDKIIKMYLLGILLIRVCY